MAHLTFVTGGIRSGKSRFAQQLAESFSESRIYVATTPVLDEDARKQINKLQFVRQSRNWRTVEETLDLQSIVSRGYKANILLIDPLSAWVANLINRAQQSGLKMTERKMSRLCFELLTVCRKRPGRVIFVTTEVGMGCVPESGDFSLYCELAGRCNQIIAQACDRMIFMVSGEALELRNNPPPKCTAGAPSVSYLAE